MKYYLIAGLALCSSYTFANDDVEYKICNAYQDESERQACYKELKVDESAVLSNGQLEDLFTGLEATFIGNNSKHDIKHRLDQTMTLYKTPLTSNNYYKCAATLVEMRKVSGVAEMEILEYMINSFNQEAHLNFPSGATFASLAMQ